MCPLSTIYYLQVYSLQLVVEMRTGEVRSLRQQLALARQQVTVDYTASIYLLYRTGIVLGYQVLCNVYDMNIP